MKWFLSRSLGILVAAALTVAGGCSDQPESRKAKRAVRSPGTQRIRHSNRRIASQPAVRQPRPRRRMPILKPNPPLLNLLSMRKK